MDANKAIEYINTHIQVSKQIAKMYGVPVEHYGITEAQCAVEALEKQIPQKIHRIDRMKKMGDWHLNDEIYHCPRCEKILYIQHRKKRYEGDYLMEGRNWFDGAKNNHCSYCGQALDWSEGDQNERRETD